MTMKTMTRKLRWSPLISFLILVPNLVTVESRRALQDHDHFVSSENLDVPSLQHGNQKHEKHDTRGSGREIHAVKTGACKTEQNILIDILVKQMHNSSFLSSCHDPQHSATLYTKSKINSPSLNQDQCSHGACPRSKSFDPAGFYPDFDIKTSFKRIEQQKTMETLLGLEKTAEYFRPEKNFFLAKGHLTPNADGARSWERRATFFYVNTVPQWQVINAGNWKNLEDNARTYARENVVVLSVWTGADGVLTLKDGEGTDREIYIAKTKDGQLVPGKLPVPRLMWKVLYNPRSNSGVAIIMLNDPFPRNHRESDKTLCMTVCSQVDLVDWKINNGVRGLTICCTIKDFFKLFPYVDDLKNLTEIPLLHS